MSISKFTYRTGQRPLDGFTIKRGVGQGGFGEVYLAVSDGGKEVALKLIRGHAEIELRGVEQCLNIKHPNLVHLYDLRKDSRGNHWLVMEFVLGESLAQVLDRETKGLPEELVREWFVGLARAVNHLHECGIVHRDLKPANIFIEQGLLKVGDYGLCKTLGQSQAAHTSNVGTVHYMAPEISRGEYNKQIDIYACGVILFEMLTGRIPFDGETIGEILMKHLTANVDLTGVPEAYRPILLKSLDKNPVRRYSNMLEMLRDFEAISRSVSRWAPPQSSDEIVVELYGPRALPETPSRPAQAYRPARPPVPSSIPLSPREKVSELAVSFAVLPFLAFLPVLAWAGYSRSFDIVALSRFFFLIVVVSAVVLVLAKTWKSQATGRVRRLFLAALGAGIGFFAFWLQGWTPQPNPSAWNESPWKTIGVADAAQGECLAYVLYFALGLGFLRWWEIPLRERKDRFSLFPGLVAAIVGGLLLLIFRDRSAPPYLFLVFPAAALIIQLVSPWQPIVTAPIPRKRRLARSHTPIPDLPLEEVVAS